MCWSAVQFYFLHGSLQCFELPLQQLFAALINLKWWYYDISHITFISPLYEPIHLQAATQSQCQLELIKQHEEIRRIVCFSPRKPFGNTSQSLITVLLHRAESYIRSSPRAGVSVSENISVSSISLPPFSWPQVLCPTQVGWLTAAGCRTAGAVCVCVYCPEKSEYSRACRVGICTWREKGVIRWRLFLLQWARESLV